MEKAQKLKSRVKGAMVYPVVVLGAAFTILMLLMTFVIPKFKDVLEEMIEGDLPPITKIVMAAANWIAKDFGWAILIGVPFGFVFLMRLIQQVSRRPVRSRPYKDKIARNRSVEPQNCRYSLDQNAWHPHRRRRPDS